MSTNHQETMEKVENLVGLTRAKNFLGHEFLTWLWYVCEAKEEWLPIRDADDQEYNVSVWVDDRIVLESLGDRHTYTLKGGEPARSLEAAAALQTGKAVKEMKIGMNIRECGEFVCTLNAADLSPRGLKIPELEVDESTEVDSILEHRIASCEAFTACLDGLFLKFLDERIEKDWNSSGLNEIKKWMKSRTKDLGTNLLH